MKESNIDIELENWKSLKSNSERMIFKLNDRKEKSMRLKIIKKS